MENPDESQDRAGWDNGCVVLQLVPIDGTARWQWKVTPREPATDQKLTIRALLIYPNDPGKAAVEITRYTADVSVQVGRLWEWTKYLCWNDPVGLLKYLLPGGAGFAFVAGLVVWWWKRRHSEKKDKEVIEALAGKEAVPPRVGAWAVYGKFVTLGVARGAMEVGPPVLLMTLLISPRRPRATVIMS